MLPTFADVDQARRLIAGAAHRTPVVTSREVDERTRARVFFKCENFQRTGSFKFRGAYHALACLAADERRRGVVTFSSGNHAQAIALAGRLLDIPRVVVMPSDAPLVKRQATEAYGAEIVSYDREHGDRETIGREIAHARGLTLIPPYDAPQIIAGQGTAALELFAEVGTLDWLFVPCGGGGLLSGSALVANELSTSCGVVGVEPETADDAARSFRTKQLQTVDHPKTVADGARTPSLGSWTFPLVLKHVSDITTVDDTTLLKTMFFLWERLKVVIEPTGALGASAVLGPRRDGSLSVAGSRVGVILSGGNVDLSQLPQWLQVR
jgi:threo-3-hydroxy-L-aspartate ammonia-lyase